MGLALPDRITHLNGICFKPNVTEFSEISCFLLLKMKTPWSKWQSEVKSQDFEALQRTWSLTGTPTWAMPLSSLFWCTNILEPCWCCKDCPSQRGQLLGTANDWPASAPPLGKLTDQTHTPAPVSGTTWVGTASKCHKQAHPKPEQPASPPSYTWQTLASPSGPAWHPPSRQSFLCLISPKPEYPDHHTRIWNNTNNCSSCILSRKFGVADLDTIVCLTCYFLENSNQVLFLV